ncbi:hypothetical protein HSBAA_38430 [Vreelandella sulfidaeris]|uniref:Uncharacterized protein n=1 Tax=Vreelandella sulfidaeris TaxID=115553 RepID=A0A455UAD3_9GAMM|nr:hypothetical protein HSBAA_38430 [Halomonas sulfidaeris]
MLAPSKSMVTFTVTSDRYFRAVFSNSVNEEAYRVVQCSVKTAVIALGLRLFSRRDNSNEGRTR